MSQTRGESEKKTEKLEFSQAKSAEKQVSLDQL
jgi:hypothetical protein